MDIADVYITLGVTIRMLPASTCLALFLCVAALGNAQACPTDPAEAALAFYAHSRDFIHQGAESPPLTATLARDVQANLRSALEQGEVGAIDWNIWTSAQDGEQSPAARVLKATKRGARANVLLAYAFEPGGTSQSREMRAVIILSERHDKCWLVADVKVGQHSVASLLAAGGRRQRPK